MGKETDGDVMLHENEAQKRRKLIEELYVPRLWTQVRYEAEERAREIQTMLDYNRLPCMNDVKRLCELVLRVATDSAEQSWAHVDAEIRRLATEAAQIELAARKP